MVGSIQPFKKKLVPPGTKVQSRCLPTYLKILSAPVPTSSGMKKSVHKSTGNPVVHNSNTAKMSCLYSLADLESR